MGWIRKPVARPSAPAGARIYAIGDIHGRLDLFDSLLAMIEDDQRARSRIEGLAEIVLLGDLIDRGPDSAGVVARAMAPLAWGRFTVLQGNHENAMLEALSGDREMMKIWIRNGGISALQSWGVAPEVLENGTIAELIEAARAAVPGETRAWLARTRPNIQLGDYFFVHAGVRPRVPLERQAIADSLWIRDEFLDSKLMHGAMIVHGHSVSTEVEERPNRIGIDTGAYATGRLTALALEGVNRWFIQTGETGSKRDCTAANEQERRVP